MKLGSAILIVVSSCLLAAVLGIISAALKYSVIDFSSRNLLELSVLTYIVSAVFYGFLALVLAVILVPLKSLRSKMVFSLLICLAASFGSIKTAFENYHRPDHFDKIYFQADLFQICSNFIIFPLIGFLIWIIKKRFDINFLN